MSRRTSDTPLGNDVLVYGNCDSETAQRIASAAVADTDELIIIDEERSAFVELVDKAFPSPPPSFSVDEEYID